MADKIHNKIKTIKLGPTSSANSSAKFPPPLVPVGAKKTSKTSRGSKTLKLIAETTVG